MAHLTYYNYEGYGVRAAKDIWYSQAVRVGDVIECSGQGGWDRITEAISPDIPTQIEQAFANVDATLKQAGSKGWAEVFSVKSYHVPLNDAVLGVMVACLKKWCPNHQPIWTIIETGRLGMEEMKVEIDVRAHVEQAAKKD